VVLTNCLSPLPNVNPSAMSREIADIYLWQELEKQESYSTMAPLSTQILDDYAGEYDYRSAVMTITRNGTHLFAQLSGQPQFEIYPKSETEFFWKVVDAQISFVRGADGKVTHAIHHQGGASFEAPKMEAIKIVTIDAKVFKDYTGDYQLQPGVMITVFPENDQLYIQVTGQPKVDIYPSSETEFFAKIVNAQINFVRDENGAVKELVLHQSGMTLTAPKVK
jgi:hypothetical protein